MTVAELAARWPALDASVRRAIEAQVMAGHVNAPIECIEAVNRDNGVEFVAIVVAEGQRLHVSLGTL